MKATRIDNPTDQYVRQEPRTPLRRAGAAPQDGRGRSGPDRRVEVTGEGVRVSGCTQRNCLWGRADGHALATRRSEYTNRSQANVPFIPEQRPQHIRISLE